MVTNLNLYPPKKLRYHIIIIINCIMRHCRHFSYLTVIAMCQSSKEMWAPYICHRGASEKKTSPQYFVYKLNLSASKFRKKRKNRKYGNCDQTKHILRRPIREKSWSLHYRYFSQSWYVEYVEKEEEKKTEKLYDNYIRLSQSPFSLHCIQYWNSLHLHSYLHFTGGGFLIGSVVSLLFFKRKSFPLWIGTGFGFGVGYRNCEIALNSKENFWIFNYNT